MKVELIDYTGIGMPSDFAAVKLIAAKATRLAANIDVNEYIAGLTDDEVADQLAYIANTIRSSWEFINYTFRISGISRACCDQMVRTRVGASFAVKTQRMVDNSEFAYVIPPKIAADPELKRDFENHMRGNQGFYQFLIEAGMAPEDARSILPMCTESPLTAQYNLSSFASLVGKRENLRAQGEYADVVKEMKALVLAVHPWAVDFLSPERKSTPMLDAILRELLGTRSLSECPNLATALKELDKVKEVWG